MLLYINRLQYSVNLYMKCETKKFMWLALLWYSFYCSGLEPNPQYLWGMPIFMKSPLSMVILLVLNSTLFDINIVTPAFLWLVFAWCVFFHLFTFNLLLLLCLKCFSYGQVGRKMLPWQVWDYCLRKPCLQSWPLSVIWNLDFRNVRPTIL